MKEFKSDSSDSVDGDAGCDFVSRFFTPQCSIFEDPVTGSSFCSLAPYWAEKLGRKKLRAKQVVLTQILIQYGLP